MSTLDPNFEARLAGLPRRAPGHGVVRQAGVAALLRSGADGPEVLLMRRAERDGDPWSGQVCLPGGSLEDDDPDLEATARRETLEEVGLDLARAADWIGTLDSVPARARGRVLELRVTPFVYVERMPSEPRLGPEADAAFWFPLEHAARGGLDDELRLERGPAAFRFPAWRYGSFTVWGMTRAMLLRLIEPLRLPR